ncbi:hypothetical protein OHR68_41740 [Spirillospora sp. NBC_00431]
MTTFPPQTTAAADPGTALRVELLLARAATAARSGDLGPALEILTGTDAGELTDHPDVFDLRARIHSQRGEWDAAERCWDGVLRVRPGDESAMAGKTRIRRLRGGGAAWRGWYPARPFLAAAVAAAAVVTAAALLITAGGGEPDGADGPAAALAEAEAAQKARQEVQVQQHRDARDGAARRAARLKALAEDLRGSGVTVTRHQDSVEVIFNEGLFLRAAELTGAGARQLDRLGKRLPDREDVHIKVLGHIAKVPGAPTHGGAYTSMQRAVTAAGRLSSASGRPMTDFDTASAEQRDAPHKDDARNRTVTLLLTVDS